MESNHPSGGLLRPAGFEDRVASDSYSLSTSHSNGLENRQGPSRSLEGSNPSPSASLANCLHSDVIAAPATDVAVPATCGR